MNELEKMKISDLPRYVLSRWDGITLLATLAVFLAAAAIGPWIDFGVGRYSGWRLTFAILPLVPVQCVLFVSLVYFSSEGNTSKILNSLILLLTPALFVYYS